MRAFRLAVVVSCLALVALLGVLTETVGLSGGGWLAGLGCLVIAQALLGRGLAESGAASFGAANAVTLTRLTLVAAVVALTVFELGLAPQGETPLDGHHINDFLPGAAPVHALALLAAVALVLDGVDGYVARRTHGETALGARFDMEVDAFLILVLSIHVAHATDRWWVLAIGAARYLFLAAVEVWPWLGEPSPPRPWAKWVAAIQGIVLTVVAWAVLAAWLETLLLAGAAVLLAESFGRQVLWLARHRPATTAPATGEVRAPAARAVGPALLTALACLVVWAALVAPVRLGELTPRAFLSIPLEGLLLIALAAVLPARWLPVLARGFGVVLGLLVIVKLLDWGFFEVLDRPFDPVNDWGYLGPGVGVVEDSAGRLAAVGVVVGAVVLAVGLMVVLVLAVRRLAGSAARHRAGALRSVLVLGMAWGLCAVFSVSFVARIQVASTSSADLAGAQVQLVRAGLEDRDRFAKQIEHDAFSDAPSDTLLRGLQGKDVLFVVVESYGRVALEGSSVAPGVSAVLDGATARLRTGGFAARSGFLTSSTYGAASWLAHASLQSGLWVDSQQRYNQLLGRDRLTLTSAFTDAGWRSVQVVPANTQDWPEGQRFYHFDQLYDSRSLGYEGPRFSYATMPDQYTLSALQRLELAPVHRRPVMAEVDLVSSHSPFTPVPRLVPWADVGDGAIFDPMPAQGLAAGEVWPDQQKVRAAYGASVEYALSAVAGFVEQYGDDNLVVVMLGDHQPHTIVSGDDAGRDVPISIIAHDPAVLAAVRGWGWDRGLRPTPQAPVWTMSDFRDRFLEAFAGP
ncbi:CDP-alcohol phosphatidyltransferase family protein [Nocardioides sp.]|uniref:CDP-alcohol phosphatidyltransferase family protein n=1 Tax=Nocardioides sp. TaxID=35761 RepID=UPI003D110957